MPSSKPRGFLTIDFEDYRRQELRDHIGSPQPPNPREVSYQLDLLLELLGELRISGTYFAVGRLVCELGSSTWKEITARHRLGCHGYEHLRTRHMGPGRFREDLYRGKALLEDASGQPVKSFRAPYYSSDGCDPWFGEALARAGFEISSSRRLASLPAGSNGTVSVPGGAGLIEVPLPAIGFGEKRLTVIGGTYFRLLPLRLIEALLRKIEAKGFIPIIYLHNYDIDATAAPLSYPGGRYWRQRAGDYVRRSGRETAASKLRELARHYQFMPLESLLERE
jgi:peptidoglycan/xylan/chitin deacetylase (PgdA/CDA1 family)